MPDVAETFGDLKMTIDDLGLGSTGWVVVDWSESSEAGGSDSTGAQRLDE